MIDHKSPCHGYPCTCDVASTIMPQVGDTVTVTGKVIARNTGAGWVTIQLPNGDYIGISVDRDTIPTPARLVGVTLHPVTTEQVVAGRMADEPSLSDGIARDDT